MPGVTRSHVGVLTPLRHILRAHQQERGVDIAAIADKLTNTPGAIFPAQPDAALDQFLHGAGKRS
jgi:hypothetical protein